MNARKKNLFRNTNYVLYIVQLIVRVYKTVKLYWFFYLPLWYTWYHYSSAWEPEGDKWQYEKDCVAAEFHSISKPVGIESRDNKKEVGHLSLIFMALFCVISFNPAFLLPNQITSWFIKNSNWRAWIFYWGLLATGGLDTKLAKGMNGGNKCSVH